MWEWFMDLTKRDEDRAYHAICHLVREFREKNPQVYHPSISLKNIAKKARMSQKRTHSALCDLEVGIPTTGYNRGREPCIHHSGDNWYLGGKQKSGL